MSKKALRPEVRTDSDAAPGAVAGGEVIPVTGDGAPVAQPHPPRRRTFVPRAELAQAAVRTAASGSAGFRADLDAAVDQDPLVT